MTAPVQKVLCSICGKLHVPVRAKAPRSRSTATDAQRWEYGPHCCSVICALHQLMDDLRTVIPEGPSAKEIADRIVNPGRYGH